MFQVNSFPSATFPVLKKSRLASPPPSSGGALANLSRGALLAGLLECIERDAVMIRWSLGLHLRCWTSILRICWGDLWGCRAGGLRSVFTI